MYSSITKKVTDTVFAFGPAVNSLCERSPSGIWDKGKVTDTVFDFGPAVNSLIKSSSIIRWGFWQVD